MNKDNIIKIKELHKNYGSLNVINGIDLDISKGDIHGLIGKSGEGKSTLLRCINGLEKYDSGSLMVQGKNIGELSKDQLREARKNMGMIFQSFSLIEQKNIYDNIGIPLKLWGESKESIKKRVFELAEIVGIQDKLFDYPYSLSGGQKQRVGIARALSLKPDILLSDESTSALDPTTANSILDLLKSINDELNITIVVVTHQLEVVKKICNKVSIMVNGKICLTGDTREVFLNQPEELRKFIGKKQTFISEKESTLIKIIFENYEKSKEILSRISLETNVKFSLEDINIEEIFGIRSGHCIVKIQSEEKENLCNYLSSNYIKWSEKNGI